MIDHATEGVAGGDRRRTVTLTCPISLAENWLAQRLAGFHEAHPSIEIIVHGTVWDASTVQQADLVISMHRHADASSGSVRLFQETLVLLAPPRIAARVQTTGDLAAERKIVVLGRQDYWSAFEDALGASFDLAVALRTNATNIALEFAASGAGVTPSPIEVAQSYIDRGLLQAVTDQRPLCPWSYYLSEARPSTHSSVITVRDWLLRGEDWVHGMSAD
ncbi:MAG: LysR substrate-binding domain-containing protein [Pseudomonadota bacterium]